MTWSTFYKLFTFDITQRELLQIRNMLLYETSYFCFWSNTVRWTYEKLIDVKVLVIADD